MSMDSEATAICLFAPSNEIHSNHNHRGVNNDRTTSAVINVTSEVIQIATP